MTNEMFPLNCFVSDESGVFILDGHQHFTYSDGRASEHYLEWVLSRTAEPASDSAELEKEIIDWPSEYHLSKKRAQLLRGFRFDSAENVLEVGCGCGAITRFLGETFKHVVAIEGSIVRARLARLRTRDQKNVQILCGPFQEIQFNRRFDAIFCIGVFEYSASFVDGNDPYDAVLRHFKDLLNPNGMLVLAIENQFGLKYFAGNREDHAGKVFVGLEGYPNGTEGARTFGKVELEERLGKHFQRTRWFFPYPDYKLPDCVVSEEFLEGGNAGEMISQFASRDYFKESPKLFEEAMVSLELSRNKMLPFFANSFLVMASNHEFPEQLFPQLAILFGSDRTPSCRTITRISRIETGEVMVYKSMASGSRLDLAADPTTGSVQHLETVSPWVHGISLQTEVLKNCRSPKASLTQIFTPCKEWLKYLSGQSFLERNVRFVPGKFLDAIWGNYYHHHGQAVVIDQEWIWKKPLRLNFIVMRAIFYFFVKNPNARNENPSLQMFSTRQLIRQIASVLDVELDASDFDYFVEIESEFQAIAHGISRQQARRALFLDLWHLPARRFAQQVKKRLRAVAATFPYLLARLLKRGM